MHLKPFKLNLVSPSRLNLEIIAIIGQFVYEKAGGHLWGQMCSRGML